MNVRDINNLKQLRAYQSDYAVYETTDNKSGIINRKGDIVFEAKDYDNATCIEENIFMLDKFATISCGDRIYFDARSGKTFAKDIVNIKSEYPTIITRDGLQGICDKDYNVLVNPTYQSVVPWKDKFLAKKDNKWGVIDHAGNVVLPLRYDDCTFCFGYNPEDDVRAVAINGEYFHINIKGERLTKRAYEYLEPFVGGLAIMKLNGQFGLIDAKENIVLLTSVTGVCDKNSFPHVFYWCNYDCLAFRQGELYGIMKTDGSVIAEPQFTRVLNVFTDTRIKVTDVQGNQGYVSTDGKMIIPCEYPYVGYNRKLNIYAFHTKDNKWGIIDADGKVIIPAIYDYVNAAKSHGLSEIAVKKDGRCYFINEKQEEVKVF